MANDPAHTRSLGPYRVPFHFSTTYSVSEAYAERLGALEAFVAAHYQEVERE